MVNAPATFVRMMNKVLEGCGEFADSFIDDIGVYSNTWEDHMKHLRTVCRRLREANLSARPSKCSLGQSKVAFLAHMVGQGKVSPTQDKVKAILSYPRPQTKKQVRSFLGTVGFYRKFIPNFSQRASVLTDLTKKGLPTKVKWEQIHQRSFDDLRSVLTQTPVLRSPDFQKTFFLRTDACDTGVGAVLEQEFEDGRHPILYLSKKLGQAEKNYAVIEKECYAIVWAIESLRVYLEGRSFVVETDHAPLQWLNRMKSTNQRLLRWSLTLQEFRFDISHVAGRENVIADVLSRL